MQRPLTLAAIIPAFNEEATIGSVLEVLRQSDRVNEIVVVDDGSTDKTAEKAQLLKIGVISQQNKGKGVAMRTGARETEADVLLFVDADLVGLTADHVASIVDPVLSGKVAMAVGLRDRGVCLNWLMRHIFPVIGGERALSRKLFLEISADCDDFGVETVLNHFIRKRGLSLKLVPMSGVSHVRKEVKYGLRKGFLARMKMISQMFRAEYKTLFKKR